MFQSKYVFLTNYILLFTFYNLYWKAHSPDNTMDFVRVLRFPCDIPTFFFDYHSLRVQCTTTSCGAPSIVSDELSGLSFWALAISLGHARRFWSNNGKLEKMKFSTFYSFNFWSTYESSQLNKITILWLSSYSSFFNFILISFCVGIFIQHHYYVRKGSMHSISFNNARLQRKNLWNNLAVVTFCSCLLDKPDLLNPIETSNRLEL